MSILDETKSEVHVDNKVYNNHMSILERARQHCSDHSMESSVARPVTEVLLKLVKNPQEQFNKKLQCNQSLQRLFCNHQIYVDTDDE